MGTFNMIVDIIFFNSNYLLVIIQNWYLSLIMLSKDFFLGQFIVLNGDLLKQLIQEWGVVKFSKARLPSRDQNLSFNILVLSELAL